MFSLNGGNNFPLGILDTLRIQSPSLDKGLGNLGSPVRNQLCGEKCRILGAG